MVSNSPDDAELERLLIQLLRVMGPAATGPAVNGAANDGAKTHAAGVRADGDRAGDDRAGEAGAGEVGAGEVGAGEAGAGDGYAADGPGAGGLAAARSPAGGHGVGGSAASGSATVGSGVGGSAAGGPGADGAPVTARPDELPAVSASEARALIELVTARGIAQGELARLLGLEKSTVSRLAVGLERKGWIRRGRDSDNQRYVRLYLTPEGREVAARVWRAWQSRPARILAALSDDERAGLSSGLRGLVRGLAAEGLLGGTGSD